MTELHLQQLLAYFAGPSFAILWGLIVVDFFRNLKAKFWTELDGSLKQVAIAALTVIGPMAIANLIAGLPIATISAADQWFYPIAMIIGRIYFVYRKGQDVKATTPVEEMLLKDLFRGGIMPAQDS